MRNRRLTSRPITILFLLPALLLGILLSFMVSYIVHASEIVVTNTNNSGAGSLRQAIADAVSGDTIVFDDSLVGETIVLSDSSLTIRGKEITIRGPGAGDLTVSGNSAYRVFYIYTDANVKISGLTIADGYTALFKGGGIYNAGTLTLEDSAVSNNKTGSRFGTLYLSGGAGIYNSGTLLVNNSIISGNKDSSFSNGGGGIYNEGEMVLENSTVTHNEVKGNSEIGTYGGGGIFNNGSGTIVGSIISSNNASGYSSGGGGGIYNDGVLSIAYTTVSNNSTFETFGAGILNWVNGNMKIEHSTIADNSSSTDGGGIENVGVMTVVQSTVSHNEAHSLQYGGGGIDNTDGILTLINSTISNNNANNFGGGLLVYDGSVTLIHTTISDNGAGIGGGIYLTGEITTTVVSLTNSIIANSISGGDCFIETGVITHTYSLIEDNSCSPTLSGDPMLGPLQDNGGDTLTHALQPGSSAVDQAGCVDVAIDQRESLRPVDIPEVPNGDGSCDMGAYEFQATGIYPTPTATRTVEPTATSTAEPTATSTPEPTATSTPEPTATSTPESTVTSTAEPTATSTPEPTATSTPEPTATSTAEPTATGTAEPTATSTPEPTATSTPEPTATSTPEPTATSTPEPGGQTLTFVPVADAYTMANRSTSNMGEATVLRLDASPQNNGYLRFDLQGLAGSVTQATLRLYVESGSAEGYSVHELGDNGWNELEIVFDNAPALGSTINSSGPIAAYTFVDVDVTSFVTSNGLVSFGASTTDTGLILLSSREGSNPPELIVEMSSGGSTATPTPTHTPAAPTYTAVPPTPTPTNSSSSSTFTAAEDAAVLGNRASQNFGTSLTLSTDDIPDIRSYLKFNIASLDGPVSSAVLRVFVNNGSSVFDVARTSSDWTETGIVYANAPAPETVIGSSGVVSSGSWLEIDITSSITGTGVYSFALLPNGIDRNLFSSREGHNAPELIIMTSP